MDDIREESVQQAAAHLMRTAFTSIRKNFEVPAYPNSFLAFHNNSHTQGVVDRGLRIATALNLSAYERALVSIGCAYHDTVQDASIITRDGLEMRVRYVVLNENASALNAVSNMRQCSYHSFAVQDLWQVTEGIHCTIPSWDVAHNTVVQPLLTPCSSPIARAIAMADIGEAGMDPDSFAQTGPALFAEDNIGIVNTLNTASTSRDLSSEMQDQFRTMYLKWLSTQPKFALGRRDLFPEEIISLDSAEKAAMKGLFSKFDDSIRRAEEAVRTAEDLPFVALMRQIVPKAFPYE